MPSNYKDQKPHFRWRCEAQDPLILFFTAPFYLISDGDVKLRIL